MFDLIQITLTGLLFPLFIFYAKSYSAQKEKNKQLELELKQRDDKTIELLRNGLCMLLRINIIDYHKRYMRKGKIPFYALENVKTMYTVYSSFGVNGVKDLMEDLGNLPIEN